MECPLVLRGFLKHHVNSQNVFGRRWLNNISISILNAARRFATVTTPTSKFIGIDLGTTNSCVAFLEGGRPVVASNPDDGSRTTPSVVAFTSEGSVLVGSPAKRQAVSNPHNTVFAVKRLVGRRFDDPQIQHCVANFPFAVVQSSSGAACVSLHGRTYTASEISAHIVSEMKRIAENQLGCAVKHAVITVPAYFDDAQRQATKEAGELAGLTVDRVVNEPTAAALAYGIDKTEDKLIAVYDLGGGTFDISILEIQKGVFEVRSTNGDTMLGGEDFDNLLADQIVGKILSQFAKDVRQHPPALQRVKEAAEQAKIALSTSQSTTISLPFIITDDSGSTHFEMELTRLEFESMVDDLVKRTILPCEQAVLDAGIRKKEINELILVGGMTRMPKVRETVQRLFSIEPAKGVNPDEAVAVGAAIQAGVLSGEVEDVLLLDVTPLSLGIETLGGAMARLITRNTTLPTKVTEVFSTAVDGQTQVEINIYQGEREMAKDNKLLGSFTLTDIPPLPRGVPRIEVSFDIDANGILNVSARDQKTGQAQRLLVTNAITNLPQRDVEAMLRSASEAADTDRRRRLLADAKLAVKILAGDVLSKLTTFGSQLPTEESQNLRQFCQTALQRAEEATESDLEAVRSLNQEIQEKALAVFQMATRKTSGGPEKSQ